MARVLVVHDFREVLEAFAAALEQAQFQVLMAGDPLAAVDTLNRYAPDAVVTRVNFGATRLNGSVLGRMARLRRKNAAIVFITHHEAEATDADGGVVLPFPATSAELIGAVRRAVALAQPPEPEPAFTPARLAMGASRRARYW